MSWTKLDDTILTNPKMLEAEELCPLAAPLLWFKALIYTNQQGLDGFVPDRMIARLLDGHKSTAKAADALKTVGLWDRVEGGIQFHNFAKHNLTKGQREEKAQKNREDQQRYRDRNKSVDPVRPYAADDKGDRDQGLAPLMAIEVEPQGGQRQRCDQQRGLVVAIDEQSDCRVGVGVLDKIEVAVRTGRDLGHAEHDADDCKRQGNDRQPALPVGGQHGDGDKDSGRRQQGKKMRQGFSRQQADRRPA